MYLDYISRYSSNFSTTTNGNGDEIRNNVNNNMIYELNCKKINEDIEETCLEMTKATDSLIQKIEDVAHGKGTLVDNNWQEEDNIKQIEL
jgi:hypothetical protein